MEEIDRLLEPSAILNSTMVPWVGLEPTIRLRRRVLSAECIPFHHQGIISVIPTISINKYLFYLHIILEFPF